MTKKIPKIIHYCWFGNNEKSNRLKKRCQQFFDLQDVSLDNLAESNMYLQYAVVYNWWERDLLESYGKSFCCCLFNLEIEQGEFLVLAGPKGCGKFLTPVDTFCLPMSCIVYTRQTRRRFYNAVFVLLVQLSKRHYCRS